MLNLNIEINIIGYRFKGNTRAFLNITYHTINISIQYIHYYIVRVLNKFQLDRNIHNAKF